MAIHLYRFHSGLFKHLIELKKPMVVGGCFFPLKIFITSFDVNVIRLILIKDYNQMSMTVYR